MYDQWKPIALEPLCSSVLEQLFSPSTARELAGKAVSELAQSLLVREFHQPIGSTIRSDEQLKWAMEVNWLLFHY